MGTTNNIISPAPENLPNTKKYAPKYIPIELLIELHQKQLTSSQMAALVKERLGVEVTSSAIRHRLLKCNEILHNQPRFKKHYADILTFQKQKGISKLTESEIKPPKTARDFKDFMTGLNIIDQMERLERGQATVNIDFPVISKKLDEIRKQRAVLQARRLELESGKVEDNIIEAQIIT